MVEFLPIVKGCCTLQLYKKAGGSNGWPHTIKWEWCGNTLVSECDYQTFSQERWRMAWDSHRRSWVVVRTDRVSINEWIAIYLAREVLGLPRATVYGVDIADHKNHDTLDNSRENLRIVTYAQSIVNQRPRQGIKCRFKGVSQQSNGTFHAFIQSDGFRVCFPTVKKKIEAGLMHWYADIILNGEFTYPEVFPPDEMPIFERQQELLRMVVTKLNEKGYPVGEWGLEA